MMEQVSARYVMALSQTMSARSRRYSRRQRHPLPRLGAGVAPPGASSSRRSRTRSVGASGRDSWTRAWEVGLTDAAAVVLAFNEAINGRDLDALAVLMTEAQSCHRLGAD